MEFVCKHCGVARAAVGTHGGCLSCGRVIHTGDGKRIEVKK